MAIQDSGVALLKRKATQARWGALPHTSAFLCDMRLRKPRLRPRAQALTFTELPPLVPDSVPCGVQLTPNVAASWAKACCAADRFPS